MKIRLFAAISVALMLAASPAYAKGFTSDADNFSIDMPTTPKSGVTHIKTRDGHDLTMTQYLSTDENAAYIVIIGTYPKNYAKPGKEEKILEGARKGANQKGTLLHERRLKLNDKYPGYELTLLTRGGKIVVRDRIYLVKNRLYQVIVSTIKENIDAPANKAFLDSFQLNE